jgi:carbonic anhydrase
LREIQKSANPGDCREIATATPEAKAALVESVALRHLIRSVGQVVDQSPTIRRLVDAGQIAVVGAMYDAETGKVEFLLNDSVGLSAAVSETLPRQTG